MAAQSTSRERAIDAVLDMALHGGLAALPPQALAALPGAASSLIRKRWSSAR